MRSKTSIMSMPPAGVPASKHPVAIDLCRYRRCIRADFPACPAEARQDRVPTISLVTSVKTLQIRTNDTCNNFRISKTDVDQGDDGGESRWVTIALGRCFDGD